MSARCSRSEAVPGRARWPSCPGLLFCGVTTVFLPQQSWAPLLGGVAALCALNLYPHSVCAAAVGGGDLSLTTGISAFLHYSWLPLDSRVGVLESSTAVCFILGPWSMQSCEVRRGIAASLLLVAFILRTCSMFAWALKC